LDYSQTVRNRKNDPLSIGHRGSIQNFDKIKIKELEKESALLSPDLNIYEPLSPQDWEKIQKVVTKSDSIVFIQILPHEQKSPFRLSNHIVNVIPKKYLVNARLNQGFNFEMNDCASLPFLKYIKEANEVITYIKRNRTKKFKRNSKFLKIEKKKNKINKSFFF
jgi:hypothetical protein